jgi:hypothetical protein
MNLADAHSRNVFLPSGIRETVHGRSRFECAVRRSAGRGSFGDARDL